MVGGRDSAESRDGAHSGLYGRRGVSAFGARDPSKLESPGNSEAGFLFVVAGEEQDAGSILLAANRVDISLDRAGTSHGDASRARKKARKAAMSAVIIKGKPGFETRCCK